MMLNYKSVKCLLSDNQIYSYKKTCNLTLYYQKTQKSLDQILKTFVLGHFQEAKAIVIGCPKPYATVTSPNTSPNRANVSCAVFKTCSSSSSFFAIPFSTCVKAAHFCPEASP